MVHLTSIVLAPLEYTDEVRRCIATFLLVLVAALVTVDPLVCPDGCTDAAPQTLSAPSQLSHTSNICLLCLKAVGSTSWPSFSVLTRLLSPSPDTGGVRNILPLLKRIDHPPRSKS
jgi:hypothetical protein